MTYRFEDFELDTDRRELRLRGQEISLQPRVFDLLTYLVEHRERVLTKDELLETLWPDTVVVDGALQRVVSLARSALQQGGAREAIRTHSRLGYRFCASVLRDEDAGQAVGISNELDVARSAFEANDWDTSVKMFRKIDLESALAASDLERLSMGLQWSGLSGDAVAPLERAVAAHLSGGDKLGAARAATQLAQIQFERLDLAVAKAWHRRAEGYLKGATPSRELGFSRYLGARIALLEGELETALDLAEATLGLGRELDDADLEGLGLLYSGHALLSLGDIEPGIARQDEAGAAVLAGPVSPWVGGMIYCGIIWACRNRQDWDRAAQWTEHFQRWCDRNKLEAFPGTCRLHRAEVLSVRGELEEARDEIKASSELLSNWAPWAEGDAFRILGDLRLSCGELEKAEEAYVRAHELGWDPQPGYALLQVERGDAKAAMRALKRSLDDRNWACRERRGLLLAAYAIAATRAGAQKLAQQAVEDLDAEPDLWSTPALEAVVSHSRSEVAFAAGRMKEAIVLLKTALSIWRKVPSPLRVANLQLRLAEFLIETGDREGADLELAAAESVFEKAGTAAMIERCRSRRRRS